MWGVGGGWVMQGRLSEGHSDFMVSLFHFPSHHSDLCVHVSESVCVCVCVCVGVCVLKS